MKNICRGHSDLQYEVIHKKLFIVLNQSSKRLHKVLDVLLNETSTK